MIKPLNIHAIPPKELPHIQPEVYANPQESLYNDITKDFVLFVLLQCIESKAPNTVMCAFCYIYKINLSSIIDKPNTLRGIAEYLGISQQSLHGVVKRLRKEMKKL